MDERHFLVFKVLHIVGGMLFVGNLIVTFVWKWKADRTRNPAVIAFAQRLVTLTDTVFTGFGALMLLLSGMLMLLPYEIEFWSVPWLMWGIALFALSGLIWLLVLIPIQMQQAKLAREFADGASIPERYWRLSRLWNGFGLLATLLPLVVTYLMVIQPR